MPLLDHFHPPLSQRRHWDSFHSAWAEAIANQLNHDLLPPRYYAEARVKLGTQVEIDAGAFEGNGEAEAGKAQGNVAVWAPARPVVRVPLDFGHPDLFEIQVLNDEEGPRLVGAIELISPANKDRPGNRHVFAVKCASYLQQGIGVILADVVTERGGNLHNELLNVLKAKASTPGQCPNDLYACAYRTVTGAAERELEVWAEQLALAGCLPTLPLWISADLGIPIDLEETYKAACEARRIT
jgi:hypothetical protein